MLFEEWKIEEIEVNITRYDIESELEDILEYLQENDTEIDVEEFKIEIEDCISDMGTGEEIIVKASERAKDLIEEINRRIEEE